MPNGAAGKAVASSESSPSRLTGGAVRFEEWILPQAGDLDITQQEILVAVGRGIQQKENLEVAEELAQALGGAVRLAARHRSRLAAPDAASGQIGHDRQAAVLPCPGHQQAPEHVEGMKDSELIVAVNTDPKAPIFDVAHYGVVADVLDLAPALTNALKGNMREKTDKRRIGQDRVACQAHDRLNDKCNWLAFAFYAIFPLLSFLSSIFL